ncbi:MAG: hypothetical protein WDN31_18740 [Hyphomicrobium sp.]
MTNSDSADIDYCTQKIDSVIALLDRLLTGDYPHQDSERALKALRTVYEAERADLLAIDPKADLDTILEFCRGANVKIARLKSVIGLLLRSSNLRNAFEIYFPVKILATELLGDTTYVVLSSEWAFSPYTFPAAFPELPDFVFIGIPASECHNPLIIPLAAHELGHVVWRRKGAQQKFDPRILQKILELYRANWSDFEIIFKTGANPASLQTDLFLRRTWGHSYKLACRQLEELFCDFVGAHLFGPSYLQSFRYLLAPSLGQTRAPHYPSIHKRAEYMVGAMSHHGVTGFSDFAKYFNEDDLTLTREEEFILDMADAATALLQADLLPLVSTYSGSAQCFKDGQRFEDDSRKCLQNLVPVASVPSVASIINAAWQVRNDFEAWPILESIKPAEKRTREMFRVLCDLVLKSLEVYEFAKRMERVNASGSSVT